MAEIWFDAEQVEATLSGRPVISKFSLQLRLGESTTVLGPNGAGKTTTMRMLTCYLPPSSGEAKVAGFDILEESMEVRKRIGYLPEQPPVYHDMTVGAYLRFVAKIKGVPGAQLNSRLDDTMEKTGVAHHRDTVIGHLSKGYRQRVGLAQALVHEPDVLILDEPTVGLDPKQIIEIREVIKGLGGDHTVILAGDGERLELTHRAHDRRNFVHGALLAANFVCANPPGLYGMSDLLGK